MSVQDIYFTLEEEIEEDSYERAIKALNAYFQPQANVPYEGLTFREAKHLATETVEQYVIRP